MKRKKALLFGDMTLTEIENREKRVNSIILFSDETGIEFSKCVCDDGSLVLCIQGDGFKEALFFIDGQIDNLKDFLNKNF
jgi:hypothetical protein